MKILRFTCKRDEILGNLNLKFNIASDYPLSIVILAGENGLGKTTLLNHIYKLCSLQPYDLFSRQFYSLTVYFSPREVCSLMMVAPELKLAHSSYKDTLLVTFGWDYKLKPSQGFFCKVKLMDGTSIAVDSAKFLKSSEIKRYLGLIFLDDSMSLRETKNSNLSGKPFEYREFTESRKATEARSFNPEQALLRLVRYEEADQAFFNRNFYLNRKGNSNYLIIVTEELNKAFKEFETGLQIDQQQTLAKKALMFKKRGKIFPFNCLSSGEKQILSTVAYLTFDRMSTNYTPVFLDEPENNLHPSWQQKIIPFVAGIFGKDTQLFVVTHSPFIVHNKLSELEERVFVFSKKKNKIEVTTNGQYLKADSHSIMNHAFNLDKFISDQVANKLIVLVEGETDQIYWTKAKSLFEPDLKVEFKWIGYYDGSGNAKFTGNSALDKFREIALAQSELFVKKVVLLYDCDTKGVTEFKNSKIQVIRLKKTDGLVYKAGIENLLTLPKNFDYSNFYEDACQADLYGATSNRQTFNKKALAKHIIEQNADFQKSVFVKFSNYLDYFKAQVET